MAQARPAATSGWSLRILGIPVRIEPSFFLLALLLGVGGGRSLALIAVWAAVALLSVLWHELGHAVVFRRFGYEPSIQLYAMGGLTWAHLPEPLTPLRQLVVSAAGPGVGLALGGVAAAFEAAGGGLLDNDIARQAVSDLIWVNVVWGIFNLLPILPLDGGGVTAGLIGLATGKDGERPTRYISIAASAVAVVVALVLGFVFAALLAGFFFASNVSALRTPDDGDTTRGGGDGDGVDVAELVEAGLLDEAMATLESLGASASGRSRALVGRALFAAGRFADAATVGEAAYRHSPHPTLAYNVACAWARQQSETETLRWLRQAVDDGYGDHEALTADPEFEFVRSTGQFGAIVETARENAGQR